MLYEGIAKVIAVEIQYNKSCQIKQVWWIDKIRFIRYNGPVKPTRDA